MLSFEISLPTVAGDTSGRIGFVDTKLHIANPGSVSALAVSVDLICSIADRFPAYPLSSALDQSNAIWRKYNGDVSFMIYGEAF